MRHSYKLNRILCILVGVSLVAISLWLTALPANAEDAEPRGAINAAQLAPTEPGPVGPIATDKSTKNPSKPYFFEFRARAAATYGHMYVLYGKVNGRGEIVTSDIAGLHPAGDSNNCENCSVVPWTVGHILFVPSETGASDGDLEDKYVEGRYRVMVDEATFKKTSEYIAKLKAETPIWHALWRNCVSFGNNIAENLGLKTPGFIWLEPKDYVKDLRELNGGGPQGPLKFAAPNAAKTKTVAAPSSAKTSVPTPANSQPPGTSSVPRKPIKQQPVASLPASQVVGVASGTTR